MNAPWPNRGQLLEMAGSFRPACVLGAAAELDLFARLGDRSLSAEEATQELDGDLRAVRILLDALAALRLLAKDQGRYSLPAELKPLLCGDGPDSVLPMVLHSMTILRGWSQLAWVAKAGLPAPRQASLRGPEADRAAFIAAMHTVSGPMADDLVAKLQIPPARHMLDVGGASGTWTLAFLRAMPGCQATIFDLPDAIPQARARIAGTEFVRRITLVPGDFYEDELPGGLDFAWLSAIVHQHGRRENRILFAKTFRALLPGGRIGVRDFVMAPDRVQPPGGALFAVNMLANTERGDTFTFEEIVEDLEVAGFVRPELRVHADDMNSVVLATKPG